MFIGTPFIQPSCIILMCIVLLDSVHYSFSYRFASASWKKINVYEFATCNELFSVFEISDKREKGLYDRQIRLKKDISYVANRSTFFPFIRAAKTILLLIIIQLFPQCFWAFALFNLIISRYWNRYWKYYSIVDASCENDSLASIKCDQREIS